METIEEAVGARLSASGQTLATAESCTGGLLAHRITNVPGSSDYFLGGFVTYSNEAKQDLVGVRPQTLEAHGAVSEETAREMARGARARMGADVAVSITGIAGPTGGTPEKPVGLVYIALSAQNREACQRFVWSRGPRDAAAMPHWDERLANKELSADAALRLIATYLDEQEGL